MKEIHMHRIIVALLLLTTSFTAKALDGYQYVSPVPGSILNSPQASIILRQGERIDATSLKASLARVVGSVKATIPFTFY